VNHACADWRGDIGAYIVGALNGDQQIPVKRHLESCAACRAEYDELVPVRGWLSLLAAPGDAGSARGGPPPGLLTVRSPGRPQIRHRRRWQAAVATIAVVAAAAVTAVAVIPGGGPAPTFQALDRMTGVHGQARLLTEATGTEIDLVIAGLPPGEHCTLVAVSGTGTEIAGTWNATYGGTAHVQGTSAIPRGHITALLVKSPDGRLLIRIPA
jgi:hypothetical protein